MIWTIVVGSVIAAALVAWAGGALQEWANRPRSSVDSRPETPQGRLHTDRERWEDTFEMRHPQQALAVAHQVEYDMTLLDGIERTVYQGLDKIWDRVSEWADLEHMDAIDREWFELSTGELIAA